MSDTVSVVTAPGIITTVTTPQGEIVSMALGGQRGLPGNDGAPGLPVDILATAPASPTEGYTYYNTTDHKLWYWNGTAWVDVTAGGGSTDALTLQGQNGAYYRSRDNHTGPSGSKTTPVNADNVVLLDSAASGIAKKLTWTNIKATLKTYFDTIYAPIAGAGAAWGAITGTLSSQTDLQSALDAKVNDTGDTMTGDLKVAAKVGVGTTSPTAKLQIGDTGTVIAAADSLFEIGGNWDGAAGVTILKITGNEPFTLRTRWGVDILKFESVNGRFVMGAGLYLQVSELRCNGNVYANQVVSGVSGIAVQDLTNSGIGTIFRGNGVGSVSAGARALLSQTADLFQWQDKDGNPLTAVDVKGGIHLASMADADAQNSTLYFSTTAGKPVYKDAGGTVNPFY